MIDHDCNVVASSAHANGYAAGPDALSGRDQAGGKTRETTILYNTLRLAALAGCVLAGTITIASAEQLCGADVVREANLVAATFDGLGASCEQDSICAITLASTNDMRVEMERASVDGSWLVKVSSSGPIDTGAGIDLVFNGSDETRVAPEFLIGSENRDTARVDDDVSQIMVTTMTESQTMSATAQIIGGRKISADANLAGLGAAMDWVDCAQAAK